MIYPLELVLIFAFALIVILIYAPLPKTEILERRIRKLEEENETLRRDLKLYRENYNILSRRI